MKMEEMVEYLKKQDFDVEKKYDKLYGVYDFTITRYGISIGDSFKYPAGKDFGLKDRIQREFMTNLIRLWHVKAENEKSYTNKKGENKMSKINNLMRDLATNSRGRLVFGNDIYDVVVRDAVSDFRVGEPPVIDVTCSLVADGTATYARKDVEMTSFVYKQLHVPQYSYGRDLPKIKDVIFNPPATIVLWADNTKTVVKCQEGDDFDPEKGLTMAITKKLFGNKGNYCEEIKKWVKKYKPEPVELIMSCSKLSSFDDLSAYIDNIKKKLSMAEIQFEPITIDADKLNALIKEPEKRWKIWWKCYDADGNHRGSGVHCTDYDCKYSATRAAHRMFNNRSDVKWIVSQDNPWEEK